MTDDPARPGDPPLEIVPVLDIEGPTVPLCWQPAPTMERCDRRKGHGGLHVWEATAQRDALTAQLRQAQHVEVNQDRQVYEASHDRAVWHTAYRTTAEKLRQAEAALAQCQDDLKELRQDDRMKTREINVLTQENLDQAAQLTALDAACRALAEKWDAIMPSSRKYRCAEEFRADLLAVLDRGQDA
jgi:hypothetical protein